MSKIWTPSRELILPRRMRKAEPRPRVCSLFTPNWMIGGGVRLATVDAADFDGTNDYATRGAGLTGAADSGLVTLAGFFKFDTLPSAGDVLFSGVTSVGGTTGRFLLDYSSGFRIRGLNSGGTTLLNVNSSALSTGTWYSLLFSCDLSNAAMRHLYLNNASDLAVTTYTSGTMDFTVADWSFGAKGNGSTKMDGGAAEFWFMPGTYIDFSAAGNRQKFISESNKPVYLGATGNLPTGTAPLIYFHLDDAETANNFAGNDGTGGAFTVTGALSTYASSPSD